VSPAEVVVLNAVNQGINSIALFQLQGSDLGQLLSVVEGLKSSGYLESFQNTDTLGAEDDMQYKVTHDGQQKLVSVIKQLSHKWDQIVVAMSTDITTNNNISTLVKLVTENEQWICIMVILGLISQDAAEEIFKLVNKSIGKDDEQATRNDRLHSLVKDSVENYVGSFIQYD
jgi:Glu-tRNA(Gln) amidotransferase subunit E-like FAD-binding protein